mmetsp:Transcript_18569/g.27210  ORF Transcript_18569/g.27210 Transcript_18569/m.27210 type:complete len:554 (-) Transcript_18569:202-1863(-)|eukprot:CAMPEP_0195524520 /NCGR_PEP_ID=MMETSP0794_2-20130614/24412_1 /TAXON_ID=515487 /ORGANISM="Stephanopyxis turris, Strain CCMP 815" /LENGTH=553 /DNA_ID=CAMNT_0040654763 /DNA_START=121 /DNA_END=1782 /DNA_ORIENTATION=-
MDWFLIISIVVSIGILAVAGVYLIVHFSHPDDKNEAYFPKLVVWLGFVLAGFTVLLLPLDVANNENYPGCDGWDTKVCGGLNMTLFWEITYMVTLAWLVLLIPFSVFFYEADDGLLMPGDNRKNSRVCEAVKYQIIVLFVIGVAFTLCYLFLSYTYIPVQEYDAPSLGEEASNYVTMDYGVNATFNTSMLEGINQADLDTGDKIWPISPMGDVKIQLSVPTFFIALMGFVGWFFFAVFGGIGLPALPLDLILAFKNRPRHMDAVEMAEAKLSIRTRVNELVDVGELLKIEREDRHGVVDADAGGGAGMLGFLRRGPRTTGGSGTTRKQERNDRKTMKQFQAAVMQIEQDSEDLANCTENYHNYNPLIPYAQLFFGVISVLISFLWIIQICIFVLPKNPPHPFLNSYFEWFDSWFPLFGVLSVALFSVYLLGCAVKGCFKFGLRFFFFTIYPMKVNKTYMSSFLFNIGLVLLCSVPVVQLSTLAFADYARYSTVNQLFGTQIQYLEFFRYFFENNVFVYAIIVFTGLTSIYLICRPRENSHAALDLRDRLKARS